MTDSDTNSVDGNNTTLVKAKLCSINICGLSQRSHMMLNKFVFDNDILLLAVQETGKNQQYKTLNNMKTFEDTNNQKNKGCAIMVKREVMFTPLPEISQISSNIDTVWGLLSWNGKNYIVGNVYLKLDYLAGAAEFLKMLQKANDLLKRHRCSGIITMGDFNARHYIWNDTTINKYGKYFEQNMDWSKYGIHAPTCPTFLAKNGNSLIDFFVSSTGLDLFLDNPWTDYESNLYSGAPSRGHVPVLINLQTRTRRISQKPEIKLDLKTMIWENWSRDIDISLRRHDIDEAATDDGMETLWRMIDDSIQSATKDNCGTKCVSKHSKPYWTKELTVLSKELRITLRAYLTRNTDSNFEAYEQAKSKFEEARKLACQQFIMKKTNNLNTAQAMKFWKEFNKLFKPPSDQQVEALVTEDGSILADNKDIEAEMFETFFKGKHIQNNIDQFDNDFFEETNQLYEEIKLNNFQHCKDTDDRFQYSSSLYNPVTPSEIWKTIKNNKSTAESFDNCQVHASMLKNLGPNAIYALSKLFTLCLRNGVWLWNSSNIVFLKKDGKASYSKPGSYRPISISSYIGKLFERVLANRLESYFTQVGLIDENQEGFSKGRNTVRYLHRLTAGIKGDIQKKLTVLCLFIDFEKAFDSVWKKGLIVKLWKVGVHGCYLQTIDSFLSERTVSLLLNGYIGPTRNCLEFGLPQGSVLSPILFKFYVFDIEAVCQLYEQITFFKFADDGTIKVVGKDLDECLFYLTLALGCISEWTSRWRMVINCDVNKTEVICFHSDTPELVPSSFNLGNNIIHLTDKTKVLGVVLDKQLNFKEHSQAVYNKLVYRWVCLCRYSNRNWGLNQTVMLRVVKTIMFSSLFYGCMIWMSHSNMSLINSLWCKVAKSAVGAVFNVQHEILEVILGVPPLQTTNRMVTIKHYLKVFTDTPDIHMEFIQQELSYGNTTITYHIRDVFRFLEWKLHRYPESFQPSDVLIIDQRDTIHISSLSHNACFYTRQMIKLFTEKIWQESLGNRLQVEGWSRIPNVSTTPLTMPTSTSREEEVLVMSLFYKNNLLNSFLYYTNRSASPLCICDEEEQSAFHLLCNCNCVHPETQENLQYLMMICNGANYIEEVASDSVSIMNCSRDVKFILLCRDVIRTEGLNLRRKINLSRTI